MSGADYTTTPNLALFKPISNRAIGTWGDLWNSNADTLDAIIGGAGASVINVLDHGAKGDGSTDDTAAIQSALNVYAGKATVFVPSTGSAYICGPLSLPAGTDMLIHGTLKLKAASTSSLLTIQTVSNVTLRGHGTLDGNRAQNSTPGCATLYVYQGTNVKISGLTLQNAPFWNLNVVASSKVVVSGVSMIGGRNANEFANGCDDCWLMNCTIDGPDSDIGFSFYGGVTNSGAVGNVVRNSGNIGAVTGDGINVLADSGQPAACKNIVIADNIISNISGGGISTYSASSNWHDGIIISNNRCYGNGRSGIGNRGDFHIDNTTNLTVIGNHSANFGSSAQPYYGIFMGVGAVGSNVIGNVVYNVGHGGGGTAGVGLSLNSPSNLLASGNYIYDNQTTHTMAASIGGPVGPQNTFIGNYCALVNTITPQADTLMNNIVQGRWAITSPANAANDAAAAGLGVPVGGIYRNGSVLQVRVV